MFAKVLSLFRKSSRDRAHSPSAAALHGAVTDHKRRLEAAIAKRDAAYDRGDTRGYGRALMELSEVQHARLAQEVWG